MKKLTKAQIEAIKWECSDRVLAKKQQEFEKRFRRELASKNELRARREQIDREIAAIDIKIAAGWGNTDYNKWSDQVFLVDLSQKLNKLERDLTLKQIDGVSCEDVITEFVRRFE